MAATLAPHKLINSLAQQIKMGPFVDEVDGKTPITDLTIEPSDILISKNNGLFGPKVDVDNAVHDVDGYYIVNIGATDTNNNSDAVLGTLLMSIQMPGALPVFKTFIVQPFVAP